MNFDRDYANLLIGDVLAALPILCDSDIFELRTIVLHEIHRREIKSNRIRNDERVRSTADRIL